MRLKVLDRLVIPSLLPKKGRMIEMIIVNSIIEIVRFSPSEITAFDLKDNERGASWDREKDTGVEFDFTPEQINILKQSVQRMDEVGEIDKDAVLTCQMILSIIK